MDHLTKDLLQLTRRSRQGAIGTQKNRQRGLSAMARDLRQLGYQLNDVRSLKPKHTDALIDHWRDQDCTTATIRNRLSWLRWWAGQINKPNVVQRDNASYAAGRTTVRPVNRAFQLDPDQLGKIESRHVQVSLLLQASFGLRREEALKFQPQYAIQDGYIRLKSSWTKGGRARTIPITSQAQRDALALASKLAGQGSLIPTALNYRQHLRHYEYACTKAGLRNTHGLRHGYAQWRYRTLTGNRCPLAGGKSWQEMSPAERKADRLARRRISAELGHSRIAITDTYLGRAMS